MVIPRTSDGRVAIFRGVPTDVGGFELHSVVAETTIPAEEAHRIRCGGPAPGRILEVAYGYTTEDDTQRLQDAYGRPVDADW